MSIPAKVKNPFQKLKALTAEAQAQALIRLARIKNQFDPVEDFSYSLGRQRSNILAQL